MKKNFFEIALYALAAVGLLWGLASWWEVISNNHNPDYIYSTFNIFEILF